MKVTCEGKTPTVELSGDYSRSQLIDLIEDIPTFENIYTITLSEVEEVNLRHALEDVIKSPKAKGHDNVLRKLLDELRKRR